MGKVSRLWWTFGLTGLCTLIALPGCGATSNDDDTSGDDDSSESGDDDASNGATSTPDGDVMTIYDLNEKPPADKTTVTVVGIVTGVTYQNNFWIEDAKGGPNSGIYVYAAKAYPTGTTVPFKAGDEVKVTASFSTFVGSGSTVGVKELSLYDLTTGSVEITGPAAGLPEAVSISDLGKLASAACTASDVPAADPYLNVLVALPEASVISASGACSTSHGEWELSDDSGDSLLVDGLIDNTYTPVLSDTVEVTGIFFYAFNLYKVEPIGDAGIKVTGGNPTPTPTTLTVTDLNKTPPADGTSVDVTAVVTGISAKGDFWIEEPTGGKYSGIFCFDKTHVSTTAAIAVGNTVEVKGTFSLYFNLRELAVTSVTITDKTTKVPAPLAIADIGDFSLTTAQVCTAATTIPTIDAYVGVVLKLPETTVSAPEGACGGDPKLGIWEVKDASGDQLLVDDDIEYTYVPVVGQTVQLTGILNYTFSAYKLNPLGDAGIVQVK